MTRYKIRAMSLGEILDAGLWLLRDHGRVLVAAAAVLHVPMALLLTAWPQRSAGAPWLIAAPPMVVMLLVVVPLVRAAVTWAVGELHLGRPVSVAGALRAAWLLLLPLSGTTLLLYLAFAIVGGIVGLMAMVMGILFASQAGAIAVPLVTVPAFVYLGFLFALLSPVMVLERTFGLRALGRSRALLRGSGGRAFGAYLAGNLVVGALPVVLQMLPGHVPVLGPIGTGLALAAGASYDSTVLALLYFDVRCRKEAFDLEHLAQLVAREPPAVPALA